ncbi:hypothetical protein AMJ83_04110 [candidate division WOR_3 bacterium SM23_42]|uniref:Uncharacterized protein n=1 Tax=candidate division WOR_3 bacterium SM23_42 TaxID=1703779 RepID=A0A0S8FTW1_UNCW3|nr:MAG: hypothetical protein AMJ83_04110 [candidate division WOR_3 bacterium SM23_42]
MSDEKKKILNMVAEGKITPDEAARLLEAISLSSERERNTGPRIWSSLEGIPKIIKAALGNAFADSAQESHQFVDKKKIRFKGISGNLEISGTEASGIDIQKDGFAKVRELEDTIVIKALSGNVKINAPKKTDLSIAGISGNVDLSEIEGDLVIESVSGDITGKGLSGSLHGEIVSGNIDLDYNTVDKIVIRSKSGDVTLKLDEKVEAELEIECRSGTITCEFDLKGKEEDSNYLRGTINKPRGKVTIENKHGNVEIRKRK